MSVRYIVAVVRKDMGNGLYAHSLYKIKVIKAVKGSVDIMNFLQT